MSMNNLTYFLSQPQFYIPLSIWVIFWKGFALWKAANKKQLIWFILLMIINTMGLLEIFYVFLLNRWDIDNGKILGFLEKKLKRNKKLVKSGK